MRIGHRRTQSSNIGYDTREQAHPFQNYSHAHRRSEVCRLLDESEAKIKEKVYSVDNLSNWPKEQKNGLFNFGKGFLSHPQNKQKQRDVGPLVAIPQKQKQNSAKGKRTPQAEVESMNQQKMRKKSVVKFTIKEKDKINPQPYDQMNRIMRIKIGPVEAKNKKYAPYLSEKPIQKNFNFKKEIHIK